MILRRQLPVYSPLSIRAIRRAAWSGLRPGRNGQEAFQVALERAYSADEVLLFATGTQALQVALKLAIRTIGDTTVALPAFTCFDVASAAVGARARVRCYDVDPATLGPDLDSLRRVLAQGTRVVVITPLYGYPVRWDSITQLLDQYGAIGIEDAAQSGYAQWQGQPVGSLGAISVLSFGRGKGWTGGRGGALLVRNQPPWEDLGNRARLLQHRTRKPRRTAEARVLGVLAAQWALGRPAWYAIPSAIPWLRLGETVYHSPEPPEPMTRAAAACLVALSPTAASEAAARRYNAESLLIAINERCGNRVRTIDPVPGAEPGYLRLPLRLSEGLAGFQNPTAALRLGLAPSYPSALEAIPQLQRRLRKRDPNPGAAELVRTLCTAPTHSRLKPRDRAALIAELSVYERGT